MSAKRKRKAAKRRRTTPARRPAPAKRPPSKPAKRPTRRKATPAPPKRRKPVQRPAKKPRKAAPRPAPPKRPKPRPTRRRPPTPPPRPAPKPKRRPTPRPAPKPEPRPTTPRPTPTTPRKPSARKLAKQTTKRIGVDKAAARLGVTPATLRRWLKTGIPAGREREVRAVAGRSVRSYHAAQKRKLHREIVAGATRVRAVEVIGITGIFYDKETGEVLGQAADGRTMRAYRIRKPGEGWRTYWTDADILAGYTSPAEFVAQYEGLTGYDVEFTWD